MSQNDATLGLRKLSRQPRCQTRHNRHSQYGRYRPHEIYDAPSNVRL